LVKDSVAALEKYARRAFLHGDESLISQLTGWLRLRSVQGSQHPDEGDWGALVGALRAAQSKAESELKASMAKHNTGEPQAGPMAEAAPAKREEAKLASDPREPQQEAQEHKETHVSSPRARVRLGALPPPRGCVCV
jgi:hypothetical protein